MGIYKDLGVTVTNEEIDSDVRCGNYIRFRNAI